MREYKSVNIKKVIKTILLIVIGASFVVLIFFFIQEKGKAMIDIENEKAVYLREIEDNLKNYNIFFLAVTKFTNPKNNYTYSELKKQNLITPYINKEFLPNKLINLVSIVDYSEIETELEKGNIALLTPSQVKPNYKTISIDNQYFWSEGFQASKYPLQNTIKRYQEINEDYITDREQIMTFFAAGEIIPARAVDRLGLNKYEDYTYLFDFFRKDIESADISIALLENSLLGDPTPCTGCMMFTGDEKVAEGLGEVGFDFISTAGNHAGDAGQKAMQNTIELLEKNTIEVTGTGFISTKVSPSNNLNIATKTLNGKTYAMIGAEDVASYYWIPTWPWNFKENPETGLPEPIDKNERYGTYTFSKISESMLSVNKTNVEAIKRLKSQEADYGYNADYSIIYMSWGVEYTNKPTKHQIELAHALVDNGADLIIGSHPHWVQSIEFYKNTPIIYSLGNFIFDQTHELETRQGIAVNLHYYNEKLKNIELIPHQICGYHQTSTDITQALLDEKIDLEEVYTADESKGCVYWQPKKLKEDHPSYQQILKRVYEFTNV
ncbi:hypothetical protein GF362_02270 [Candidatus Dojkabacteria bacterium]|nr:hypothetical protein [Candidatus Dojkabacteria bacterium]